MKNRIFSWIYYEVSFFVALVAIITGLGTLVLGVEFNRQMGVQSGFHDPALNFQIRHLGAIWFGYGWLILYCLRDLQQRYHLLNMALVVLAAGGIGRVITLIQFGLPEIMVGKILAVLSVTIALLLAPVMIFWSRRHFQQPLDETPK
ncbi:MAG: DUF4345 domain-containing protein [Gammaproteobacteria bacterium]|nr:DUF4345 domain-containing protein [Gammaproteobacteria bacterium]